MSPRFWCLLLSLVITGCNGRFDPPGYGSGPGSGDALIAMGLGIAGGGFRAPTPAYTPPYAPPYVPVSAASSGCGGGHWVMKVEGAGAVVTLEDRTAWLVTPLDRIKTMLWLPVTNISVCDGSLLNTDDREIAYARQVR